jgi:hypothetical protein
MVISGVACGTAGGDADDFPAAGTPSPSAKAMVAATMAMQTRLAHPVAILSAVCCFPCMAVSGLH